MLVLRTLIASDVPTSLDPDLYGPASRGSVSHVAAKHVLVSHAPASHALVPHAFWEQTGRIVKLLLNPG